MVQKKPHLHVLNWLNKLSSLNFTFFFIKLQLYNYDTVIRYITTYCQVSASPAASVGERPASLPCSRLEFPHLLPPISCFSPYACVSVSLLFCYLFFNKKKAERSNCVFHNAKSPWIKHCHTPKKKKKKDIITFCENPLDRSINSLLIIF